MKLTAEEILKVKTKGTLNIIEGSPLHNAVISAMEYYSKQEKENFAIDFANWVVKLSPSQKTSVWSKNGEHSGLFTMDNEQLLEVYNRKIKRKNNE